MDKRQILTYSRCLCCGKTFNQSDMIDIWSNSILIDGEITEISDLFLALFLVTLEPGKELLVCFECKDYLVQFHTIKKNVKRYECFDKVLKISRILSNLEDVLNNYEKFDMEIVSHTEDEILITSVSKSLENDSTIIVFQPEDESDLRIEDIIEDECGLEVEKIIVTKNESDLRIEEIIVSNEPEDDIDSKIEEIIEEESDLKVEEIIVNDQPENVSDLNLENENVEIIAEKSIIIVSNVPENAENDPLSQDQENPKPPESSKKRRISETCEDFLTKKPKRSNRLAGKSPEISPKKLTRQDKSKTAKKSDSPPASSLSRWNNNSSLTEEQKNWIWENASKGEVIEKGKSVWKCGICRVNTVSNQVLRKHLRDVHVLKKENRKVENRRGKAFMEEVRNSKGTRQVDGVEEVIWECKRCGNVNKSESGFIKHLQYKHINSATIDPLFIAKCKKTDENGEVVWSCPECPNTYKSPVGLKNHLKSSHANIDFGGERYLQKIQEINERANIIKEEEKKSEILLETELGVKKIFECKRCPELRYFRSESGFKCHMKLVHFKRFTKLDEAKIANCRDPNEEFGRTKVWKCPICGASFKTKEGFMSHVSHLHPGEFDEKENTEKGENEEKTEEKTEHTKPPSNNTGAVEKTDEFVLKQLAEQITYDCKGALKAGGYKFPCNECGLFFNKHYKTHLEGHKTLKHLASLYQLPTCESCRLVFCDDESMRRHLEWHVEGSPVLPAFPSSGLAYYGGKEFKPPSGTADDAIDESTWKCGHCIAMFWTQDEVTVHVLLMHTQTLICPVDHFKFSGNRGLAQYILHMKNKHPELFPDIEYPCTYCHASFSTIFEKLAHMKKCSEKKLICDYCGKRFFCKVQLAHHMRIEKGIIQYICSICGKNNFKNSMDLRLHVSCVHTTERRFDCTFCCKTFKNSAARSSHMETHTGNFLKCSICGKAFKKRTILAKHIKTVHFKDHKDDFFSEFDCKLCKKSFVKQSTFKNHLKIVHKIIEEDQKD